MLIEVIVKLQVLQLPLLLFDKMINVVKRLLA